jgi:hypothetical protein
MKYESDDSSKQTRRVALIVASKNDIVEMVASCTIYSSQLSRSIARVARCCFYRLSKAPINWFIEFQLFQKRKTRRNERIANRLRGIRRTVPVYFGTQRREELPHNLWQKSCLRALIWTDEFDSMRTITERYRDPLNNVFTVSRLIARLFLIPLGSGEI